MRFNVVTPEATPPAQGGKDDTRTSKLGIGKSVDFSMDSLVSALPNTTEAKDSVTDESRTTENYEKEKGNSFKDRRDAFKRLSFERKREREKKKSPILSAYTRRIFKIHRWVCKHVLLKVMEKVIGRPILVVCITIAVSVFIPALAYALGKFELETTHDIITVPPDAMPMRVKNWINNESGFPPSMRMTQALIHAEGENVLGYDGVRHIFNILQVVEDTEGFSLLCGPSIHEETTPCSVFSVTNFWPGKNGLQDFEDYVQSTRNDTFSEDDAVLQILSSPFFPDGSQVQRDALFGFVNPDDPDEAIVSATSILTAISIPSTKIESVKRFETKVASQIVGLGKEWTRKGNRFRVEVFNAFSVDIEVERAIEKDLPLVVSTFIIMAIFTAFVMTSFKKDKHGRRFIHSDGILAIGAVFTVMLSMATGYGICALAGIPLTQIAQILPFVLIGVGLDDSIVLEHAYLNTDTSDVLSARLNEMMIEVGPSITMTSLTDIFAFAFGATSQIPMLKWACGYASVCVLVDYLYQITFFIALMVLNHKRIESNRYDYLVCLKASGPLPHTSSSSHQDGGEENVCLSTGQNLMLTYVQFLVKPMCKVVVSVAFAALLIAGIIFASKTSVDLDMTDLTPDDSYVDAYVEAERLYFSASAYDIAVYFRDIDASSLAGRQDMFNYINRLQDVKYIPGPPEKFWLEDLVRFYENANLTHSDLNNQTLFNQVISEFLDDAAYYQLYAGDIVLDKDSGGIFASRTTIDLVVDFEDAKSQIEAYSAMKKVTESQPANAEEEDKLFTFNNNYGQWEHLSLMWGDLFLTLSLSILAVTALSLCFLPHPLGTLMCIVCVVAVDVELVGLVYVVGFYINTVTTCVLICSIGFNIDYCMHVVHAFLLTSGLEPWATREDRVTVALTHIGLSVLLGGLTTLIGIIPLAFSAAYSLWSFFVLFLGMVILGLAHGLILLPVVLSTVGPCLSDDDETVMLGFGMSTRLSYTSASTFRETERRKGIERTLARLSREDKVMSAPAFLLMKTSVAIRSRMGMNVGIIEECNDTGEAIKREDEEGEVPLTTLWRNTTV